MKEGPFHGKNRDTRIVEYDTYTAIHTDTCVAIICEVIPVVATTEVLATGKLIIGVLLPLPLLLPLLLCYTTPHRF